MGMHAYQPPTITRTLFCFWICFSFTPQSLVLSRGEKIIRDLYAGTQVNLVQCLECAHVSRREEDFLDISLPVKGIESLTRGYVVCAFVCVCVHLGAFALCLLYVFCVV